MEREAVCKVTLLRIIEFTLQISIMKIGDSFHINEEFLSTTGFSIRLQVNLPPKKLNRFETFCFQSYAREASKCH